MVIRGGENAYPREVEMRGVSVEELGFQQVAAVRNAWIDLAPWDPVAAPLPWF